MLTLIDRYVLKRGITTLLVIIALVISIVVGMDFILNLNTFLRSDDSSGTDIAQLILWYYFYSLPSIVSPLLPLALAISLVVTCAPMLKRGEFVALTASGVNLRTATRGLLIMAAVVGACDVYLSDRLAPHFETERSIIDDQIRSRVRGARTWQVNELGSQWYANSVVLRDKSAPQIGDLIVVTDQAMVQARSLSYDGQNWTLNGPLLYWRLGSDGVDEVASPPSLPCHGDLALPYSPEELSQLLISRNALSSEELWAQGGHLNMSLIASRWIRLLTPLAMALLILPYFVRFENHKRLTISGVNAILIGLCPLFAMSMASMSADASSLPPLLSLPVMAVLTLLPGFWYYLRWHL